MNIPYFYKDESINRIGEIYQIDYKKISEEANRVLKENKVKVKENKYALLLFDFQISLMRKSLPAITNICNFIYTNIENISDIFIFSESNSFIKINFSSFWNDKIGRPLKPNSIISLDKVKNKEYLISNSVRKNIPEMIDGALEKIVCREIEVNGPIKVEDYNRMAGGVGSAMVPLVEEAVFYHSCLSGRQSVLDSNGLHPLRCGSSIFESAAGDVGIGIGTIGSKKFYFEILKKYERILFAGCDSKKAYYSALDLSESIGKEKIRILNNCCCPFFKGEPNDFKNNSLIDNIVNSHDLK
jgi:hypothetical protein